MFKENEVNYRFLTISYFSPTSSRVYNLVLSKRGPRRHSADTRHPTQWALLQVPNGIHSVLGFAHFCPQSPNCSLFGVRNQVFTCCAPRFHPMLHKWAIFFCATSLDSTWRILEERLQYFTARTVRTRVSPSHITRGLWPYLGPLCTHFLQVPRAYLCML